MLPNCRGNGSHSRVGLYYRRDNTRLFILYERREKHGKLRGKIQGGQEGRRTDPGRNARRYGHTTADGPGLGEGDHDPAALRPAARAGEAGRGFAVVADEIRQLAEKTREETENIATILGELSDNAEMAGGAVAKSVEAAQAQDELISKASESFTEVNDNVGQLISDIGEIDYMLSDLSQANNKIVDNIMHLSATTEEVTASSSQAAELSVQNLNNAEQAKELLDGVILTSHELDKYIRR